jgi:hypothetical protein
VAKTPLTLLALLIAHGTNLGFGVRTAARHDFRKAVETAFLRLPCVPRSRIGRRRRSIVAALMPRTLDRISGSAAVWIRLPLAEKESFCHLLRQIGISFGRFNRI